MRTRATGAAIRRILIYLAAITAPLLLSATTEPQDEHEMHGFIEQLASLFGLLAFTILSLQFVLSARIKWIEWPFGLDILYRFHKAMGVFAGVLLVTHPVLMAWGRTEWSLLTGWNVQWPIYLGRIALLLVFGTIVLSLFPKAFNLPFQKWRGLHNGIALSVLGLGFVHSLAIGGDLKSWLMRFLWASTVGVAIAAYAYHKSLWPRWLRQCRYEVLEVQQETHDVWTLKLEPAIPGGTISYLPGQFHFLTLHRQGFPVEEHPFTISSSPTERIFLASTIKESGDFTKTVHQTRAGDAVSVRGPFGRFSYLLHSDESELVFLVGGIGITPVMSMLRYMRDSRDWKPALLIYNNRTERDIVFREELDDMVGVSNACLRVAHVLSRPDDNWRGDRGHIDRELIVRLAGDDLTSKGYYICGPPRMAQDIITIMRNLRVPPSRIHTELYSL